MLTVKILHPTEDSEFKLWNKVLWQLGYKLYCDCRHNVWCKGPLHEKVI